MTLGLKLGRRLVGAVALDDETVTFHDSRFVRARRDQPGTALSTYVGRVLDQVRPSVVYMYAPVGVGTVTAELVGALEREAARRGIPVKPLTRTDVLGSFGLRLLRTRAELREVIGVIWPALAEVKRHRQDTVAEAAAAALVGDISQEWPPG
jgi:hypothetical protein